ncbi:tetraspanin-19-like [Salvia splendens]|uniref:tetraspanin-19-like n=1 Tax=Salvia splendens TaxID=180675 RepID=UPI001C25DE80|nr:tetraspanin-19-like [Salvia splendens]
MGRMPRSCVQSLLKLVNSLLGMAGIAMTIYSLWMFRVWLHTDESMNFPVPWFIYTILGLGVSLCVITCSGHIAAETANGCCLYIYMAFVFMIFLLEAAVTTDVFLNHDWQEDFPADATGNFDRLKDFIKDNFDICKWIGLSMVAVQGLSMLLAMVLKALGPHSEKYYESDDEYLPDRVPLLKNYVPPQSYGNGSEPAYGVKSDSWIARINSKVKK